MWGRGNIGDLEGFDKVQDSMPAGVKEIDQDIAV